MMEGDSPELEIDSELVMSFYDQYQVRRVVPFKDTLDTFLIVSLETVLPEAKHHFDYSFSRRMI